MCSIMGYKGKGVSLDEFKEHFDKTISRGPDMQRILRYGDTVLGFERLAIMGLTEEGMQPFELNNNSSKNALVCNGEIYGFRKIKKELEKEYTFVSDSDCEILLPMYEKSMEEFGQIRGAVHWTVQIAMHEGTLRELKPVIKQLIEKWGVKTDTPADILAGQLLYGISATIHSEEFEKLSAEKKKKCITNFINRIIFTL